MNVGSLFSGIGGLDLGLENAGHRVVFQAESDEYRRRVLAARFPGVTVHDDVASVATDRPATQVEHLQQQRSRHGSNDAVAVLCGGFPCQDLSVAGRRKGLAGDRSGLFFEFARIADTLQPRYVLVENVPGLLSSNGGRDFGTVLGTLADVGYGLAYRILDSRYFGVPQRRRRVFILGVLADGDPRAAAGRAGQILAVGARCNRHSQAGGEAGQDVAPTLGASVGGGRGWDANPDQTALISPPLTRSMAEGDPPDQVAYVHSGGESYNESEQVGALTQQSASETSAMSPLVAAPLSHGSNPNSNAAGRRREDDENLVMVSENQRAEVLETPYARQLTSGGGKPGQGYPMVRDRASVRRLTPVECERLQGFPDQWTQLGSTPDSRRYAALGDAVTVNVAEWIGHRIRVAA